MKRIAFFEPVWQGHVHLVANSGVIQIAHAAYPQSEKFYIGDHHQHELIKAIDPLAGNGELKHVYWSGGIDKDTLPTHAWKFRKRLMRTATHVLRDSDLIVLTSCTANTLTAITSMGAAHKTMAVLHGNANELTGWRSRNPLRRLYDMTNAMKRFCHQGGTVIVLEERIKTALGESLPWMATHIQCLAHALSTEEASDTYVTKPYAHPIKVGFAGLATHAKGFPEFLQLAAALQRANPGAFEFHAFGKLHQDCKDLDQSMLTTKAGMQSLHRKEFIEALNTLHYIFLWHQDYYYANAASGVMYDAINLVIPVIARKGSQISEWENAGLQIGSSHATIEDAIAWLTGIAAHSEEPNYRRHCLNEVDIRRSLGVDSLSRTFSRIVANMQPSGPRA